MKNPSVSSKFSIEYIQRDAGGFRITDKLLERVLLEALKVNKKPLITLELNRNEKENFVLDIQIKIKRKQR